MPIRPSILTLTFLLLAALIAAATIALLLALTQPSPAPVEGPGPSPAPAQPAEPAEGPTLTIIAETSIDAQTGQALHADVYLNGALTYQHVTTFQVTVPLDGSTEIRVTAPGYAPWGLTPMSADSSKIMSGPVRLVRE